MVDDVEFPVFRNPMQNAPEVVEIEEKAGALSLLANTLTAQSSVQAIRVIHLTLSHVFKQDIYWLI